MTKEKPADPAGVGQERPAIALDFSGMGSMRAIAMATGDIRMIVEAEVARVLNENDGNPVDACKAGLSRLQAGGVISGAEASLLGRLCVLIYQRQRKHLADDEATDRIIAIYQTLAVDAGSSPLAIAIASAGASFTASSKAPKSLSAMSTGDVNLGVAGGAIAGAVVGLGIGGLPGAFIGGVIGSIAGAVTGACA